MKEMKVGMIGLDTSHCPAFAKILNDGNNPHHLPGFRVTTGFPGGSRDFSSSYTRVEKFTAQLRDEFGLEIVDSIEKVAQECDAILLHSVDGRKHREEFEKIARFGKPVFVDKPFTTSTADARAILEAAEKHGAPVFSCSAIRYAVGIGDIEPAKAVAGCVSFGPMAILDDFPGFFWYGIHSAEVLFSKMGPGCREVTVTHEAKTNILTGRWDDGRLGVIYGYQVEGLGDFGCVVYAGDGIHTGIQKWDPPAYARLMPKIADFFRTGKPAVPHAETLEIIAFLEAANRALESGRTEALAGA